MANRFDDKVVVVAGGTGGLGRSVSLAFLSESARVVVTYRNPSELNVLQKEAGARSTLLTGLPLDVTDDAAVQRATAEIVREQHRINFLVNTVGAYAGGTPLWKTELQTFDQMLTLNLRSGYVLAREVVPYMLKQRNGALVNISSRAAIDHAAGAAAYAASKAAAVALFDSLAADLLGTGVRANSVLPSIIDTEVNRNAMPKADFSKWPKPEDIARVILFLCSDDAKLIHGASIPVYGAD